MAKRRIKDDQIFGEENQYLKIKGGNFIHLCYEENFFFLCRMGLCLSLLFEIVGPSVYIFSGVYKVPCYSSPPSF